MRKKSFQSGLPAQTGFTLIELLVVITIIAIFAGIVIAAINKASGNGRDSQRLVNIKELQVAVERYYDANGHYPCTNTVSPTGACSGIAAFFGNCPGFGSHPAFGTNGYIPGLAPTYIAKLPLDPRQTSGGCYLYKSDGIDYMILVYATIEGAVPAQYQRPVAPTQQDYAVYTSGASGW